MDSPSRPNFSAQQFVSTAPAREESVFRVFNRATGEFKLMDEAEFKDFLTRHVVDGYQVSLT